MGMVASPAVEPAMVAMDKQADQRVKRQRCTKCGSSDHVRSMIDNYRGTVRNGVNVFHSRQYRCMVCGNPLTVVIN